MKDGDTVATPDSGTIQNTRYGKKYGKNSVGWDPLIRLIRLVKRARAAFRVCFDCFGFGAAFSPLFWLSPLYSYRGAVTGPSVRYIPIEGL